MRGAVKKLKKQLHFELPHGIISVALTGAPHPESERGEHA